MLCSVTRATPRIHPLVGNSLVHNGTRFISMSSEAAGKNRSYGDAITLLNSCQSNSATIEHLRKTGYPLLKYAQHEMTEYLRRIGYRVRRFCMHGLISSC